ncbi:MULTISPECIES: cytochrome P450 [unclassified Streptomyces]|uniref:cytochrome P450 n=1 Tax=unclassified Streptomyces TaxID=2593676 RepID=UPI0036FD13B3
MTTETTDRLPAILDGFDLTDQAAFADGLPYELFARLRRDAPLLRHPAGHSADGEDFWVLTRHADIVGVTRSPDFSAQGGGGRKGGGTHLDDMPVGVHAGVLLPMMDNPRHDAIKHLLSPAVTGAAAARLTDALRERARELVEAFVARGAANFVDEVSEPFALEAMALLLGIPHTDRPRLQEWVHQVLGFTNRATGEPDAFSVATFTAMQEYFTGFVRAKREMPADDLGSLIAAGELPEGLGLAPLSDREREGNAVLFLVSGFEQPRNTIAAGVLAFARNPDQWEALRADRSLMPTAVEEILRWAPANPYNRRTAVRDVELHGQVIRAGEKVTLWWPSANRDEAVYDAPERFDVRRPVNPHVSFGHGTHSCLGDEVGRLLIQLVLETLLDRVTTIRQTGPERWGANNKHTVLLDLPVEFTANGSGS